MSEERINEIAEAAIRALADGAEATPPKLTDIKTIYDEETLTDEQAAALDAMHAGEQPPRGKRVPRKERA